MYKQISVGPFTLPYQLFGEGPELLIAFHGFGKSSSDFRVFEEDLGKHYTIIALDFFYHGQHGLSPEQKIPVFSPSHMSGMVEKLLWEHKRVKCSLIGYSQGGRLAMGIVHRLPHRIRELFLLAPDGIKKNKARHFVGNTRFGRFLGRHFVHHPGLIQRMIALSVRLSWISEKQSSFFKQQLETKSGRFRVYHTWLALRSYHPHSALMRHYINDRKIRTVFFAGKYDSIINAGDIKRFARRLGKKVKLVELDCGHDLLSQHRKIADEILGGT